MAKKVEILIDIDEEGKVHARPKGTENTECLDLMSFLDKIPGFSVEETQKLPEADRKKVQIVGNQHTQVGS